MTRSNVKLFGIEDLARDWNISCVDVYRLFNERRLRASVYVTPALCLAGVSIRDTSLFKRGKVPSFLQTMREGEDISKQIDIKNIIYPLQGIFYRANNLLCEKTSSDGKLHTALVEDFDRNTILVLKPNSTFPSHVGQMKIWSVELGEVREFKEGFSGTNYKVSEEERRRFELAQGIQEEVKSSESLDQEINTTEEISGSRSSLPPEISGPFTLPLTKVNDGARAICSFGNELAKELGRIPNHTEIKIRIFHEHTDITEEENGVFYVGTKRYTPRSFKDSCKRYLKNNRD